MFSLKMLYELIVTAQNRQWNRCIYEVVKSGSLWYLICCDTRPCLKTYSSRRSRLAAQPKDLDLDPKERLDHEAVKEKVLEDNNLMYKKMFFFLKPATIILKLSI